LLSAAPAEHRLTGLVQAWHGLDPKERIRLIGSIGLDQIWQSASLLQRTRCTRFFELELNQDQVHHAPDNTN
jgi:hypothetical protein